MAATTMRLCANCPNREQYTAEEIHQARLDLDEHHGTYELEQLVSKINAAVHATREILNAVSPRGVSLPRDLSGKEIESKTVANELAILRKDLLRVCDIAVDLEDLPSRDVNTNWVISGLKSQANSLLNAQNEYLKI